MTTDAAICLGAPLDATAILAGRNRSAGVLAGEFCGAPPAESSPTWNWRSGTRREPAASTAAQ